MIAEFFVLVFFLTALNAKKSITGFLLAIGISAIFEIYILAMISIYLTFMFFDRIESRTSMGM